MTRRNGMFITDDEIRARFGDKADAIIAALDELGTTQKNKATRPKEARCRPAVDVWLEANGYGAAASRPCRRLRKPSPIPSASAPPMSEIVDLSARRPPVLYTLRLTHHWDGRVDVFVEDVADDERSRDVVADVLNRAAEAWGRKAAPHTKAEVERLMHCIDMAMGCLDPESKNRDEALAWYRLYDAEMGREPRPSLNC